MPPSPQVLARAAEVLDAPQGRPQRRLRAGDAPGARGVYHVPHTQADASGRAWDVESTKRSEQSYRCFLNVFASYFSPFKSSNYKSLGVPTYHRLPSIPVHRSTPIRSHPSPDASPDAPPSPLYLRTLRANPTPPVPGSAACRYRPPPVCQWPPEVQLSRHSTPPVGFRVPKNGQNQIGRGKK